MNVLLEQLRLFSEWSGMDLCVLKCEATAYHYGTKTELSVDSLHIGDKRLTLLPASSAYKYLGVRMTVHGDTSAEVAHVQARTQAISKLMKGHQYNSKQATALLETCVVPVFTYSGPLTAWLYVDLNTLLDQWGLLLKRAWHLTDRHPVAMFILPPEHGGVAESLPGATLAKHTIGLVLKLTASLDGELMALMNDEWNTMHQALCIQDIRLGQLLLLL
eukprot:1685775-Rhodomonas_salina.3